MFKYESIPENSVDSMTFPSVSFTLPDDTSLDDQLAAFEDFLKASGYNFDGELQIVKEELSDDKI